MCQNPRGSQSRGDSDAYIKKMCEICYNIFFRSIF